MEEDKKLGMLFGLAMGDALGVPHEFYRSKFIDQSGEEGKFEYSGYINTKFDLHVRFQFTTTVIPAGSVSDDTEMTLALVKCLKENDYVYDEDKVALAYMKWANQCKMCGRNTRQLFKGVKTLKGYKNRYEKLELVSQSNGSLMRAAGLIFADKWQKDYKLSNPNEVNKDANKVFIKLLKKILKNRHKDYLKEYVLTLPETEIIKQSVLDSLSETERDISGKSKGWVAHCLYIALKAFWNFEFIEDAFEFIITKPNTDSDTNAAVCGALFGCYLGYSELLKGEKTKFNIDFLNTKTGYYDKIIL